MYKKRNLLQLWHTFLYEIKYYDVKNYKKESCYRWWHTFLYEIKIKMKKNYKKRNLLQMVAYILIKD